MFCFSSVYLKISHTFYISIYKKVMRYLMFFSFLFLNWALPLILLSPFHLLHFAVHTFPSPTHVNTKFVSFICFLLGYIIIFNCTICEYICSISILTTFMAIVCVTKEYFAYFSASCFSYSTIHRGNVSKSIGLAHCRFLNGDWHDQDFISEIWCWNGQWARKGG